MLSRRLVLPALGALALMVSAGAVWKAEAQSLGGVTVTVNSVAPSTVASGQQATLVVTATTTAGTITAVNAQTLAGAGVGASAVAHLSSIGGNQFQGNLTAPKNNTKNTANVKIRVIVKRTGARPVSVGITTTSTLGVRGKPAGGHNPNQPPPPPDI